LAIMAYMTGGAAVSLAYYEVIYMVIMLMELLRLHVERLEYAGIREKFWQSKMRSP